MCKTACAKVCLLKIDTFCQKRAGNIGAPSYVKLVQTSNSNCEFA